MTIQVAHARHSYLYLADPTQISFKSRNSARIAASGLAWQIRFHIQASTSTGVSKLLTLKF